MRHCSVGVRASRTMSHVDPRRQFIRSRRFRNLDIRTFDSAGRATYIRFVEPAPKHPTAMDDSIHSQRISIISENLTAIQGQIRKIERAHANEARTNRLLVEEVLALQKMLQDTDWSTTRDT
ncbi:hypothetical protein VFPBJ_11157 [Purpureocillium lilacinum]|uniref:Uncharacterized protein n=1 Tax=Purpureocillium lilacinum TaxID=33203 RepID=A0A179FJ06_PURLI|nr:hypothetical protein VFPBJ_11157 [Purpureocillium lilacinum]